MDDSQGKNSFEELLKNLDQIQTKKGSDQGKTGHSLDTQEGIADELQSIIREAEREQDRISACGKLIQLYGFDKQAYKDVTKLSDEELQKEILKVRDILEFMQCDLTLDAGLKIQEEPEEKEEQVTEELRQTIWKSPNDPCVRCHRRKPIKNKKRHLCKSCCSYMSAKKLTNEFPIVKRLEKKLASTVSEETD